LLVYFETELFTVDAVFGECLDDEVYEFSILEGMTAEVNMASF
jgi:hypothetical protein